MATFNYPASISSGAYVTSGYLNSLRDAANFGSGARPRAKVYFNSGTSLAATDGHPESALHLTLSGVAYDNDNMANAGGLDINTAGTWLVVCNMTWTPNGTNARTAVLIETTTGNHLAVDTNASPPSTIVATNKIQWCGFLAAGRHLDLYWSQNSGGSLQLANTGFAPSGSWTYTQEGGSIAATWLGT